jgi:hypothetical protein
MDQATAERIAAALETIAAALATPQFIPTGFAVMTPEEMKRRQLAAGLSGQKIPGFTT